MPLEAGAYYIIEPGYLDFKRLFCSTKLRRIRSKDAQKSCLSNEQFHFIATGHCQIIRKSLGSRIVFQMDQTVAKNQKVFRYICERGKISNLDCRLSLCARGNLEKEITSTRKPLHNLQILSVTIFEKISIYQLITERDSMLETHTANK